MIRPPLFGAFALSSKITLVSAVLIALAAIGYVLYAILKAVYELAVALYALFVIAALGGL